MPDDTRLFKSIGHGNGSQMEYDIYVENGRLMYRTENDGHRFYKNGPEESTKEVSLYDLKDGRVRGSHFYDEAKAEVDRQLEILSTRKAG